MSEFLDWDKCLKDRASRCVKHFINDTLHTDEGIAHVFLYFSVCEYLASTRRKEGVDLQAEPRLMARTALLSSMDPELAERFDVDKVLGQMLETVPAFTD